MNIVENGKDSFQKCVKSLLELNGLSVGESKYNFILKDVIINLHHSTEVLFKYLVSQKSDFLVYASPLEAVKSAFKDKENGRQFDGGTLNTIQFLDAVHLVYVLYNIEIKSNTRDLYGDLNTTRNAITHYTHDFSVEHTLNSIAFLMVELYKIYSIHISDFDKFAKDAHLKNDITSIQNKAALDALQMNLTLLKSVIDAKSEFEKNKTYIGQILSNKEPSLHYDKCIVCGKPSFKVKSQFIVSHDIVSYIGDCDICKYHIGHDNVPMIVHHCKDEPSLFVKSLINAIMHSLNSVIKGINGYDYQSVESLIRTHKDEIGYLLSNYQAEFESSLRTEFEYFLDDVYTVVMEGYFEDEYYYKLDIIEEIVTFKDAKLSIGLNLIKKRVQGLPARAFRYKYLKLIKEIDSCCNKSIIDLLVKNITTSHVSYHQAMYKDGHSNEEHWVEVEIRMELTEPERDVIKDSLLEHLIKADDSDVYYGVRDPWDH